MLDGIQEFLRDVELGVHIEFQPVGVDKRAAFIQHVQTFE